MLRGRSREAVVATIVEREPVVFRRGDFEGLRRALGNGNAPEWRARILAGENCGDLQTRIKELETRLKDLEKKLQK